MHLVDTERYPLHQLADRRGEAFLQDCVASFASTGALVLPGFLTDDAVTAIAADTNRQLDHAFHCRSEHNILLDDAAPEVDPLDPRARRLSTSVGSIPNDRLGSDSTLQQLYDWPELTRFIGSVLGHCDLYQGADPLGALSVNVYGSGDMHEWHFDESHFSVTIMIQEAEHGGHFEFVPGLRNVDGVDVVTIGKILDGDESLVQRLPFAAGSLSIFAGRNTLHRVTEISGDRRRLVPVLTYDTAPGSVNSEAVRKLFWGRTA